MDWEGSGTGRSLPPIFLLIATISSLSATLLSLWAIYTHLKRYLKPNLQRHVVRLILIVPIFSTSSLLGLFSLPAAFLIDLVRDLYEAFAIYSFFELLVAYLGGERSTLILLIGRKPIAHPWPFNLFLREMDMSDPYTFLATKRGVLQYVQIKPILAAATVILKAFGKYEEGSFTAGNGYTYISTVYNISIFLSLYCLAIFWKALSAELAPFKPTAKFLTVKGVVFATFWQGWAIGLVVSTGLVKNIGPISDPDFLRLGLQDLLLTLEMPLFALGHLYAFGPSDYVDSWASHQARLPITYAIRDAVGGLDVMEDITATIRGTGYGYARFEPAKGAVHQGLARSRRLHAGLRYTQGGKGKYFLPAKGMQTTGTGSGLGTNVFATEGTRMQGPFTVVKRWMEDKRMRDEGYAPMSVEEQADVVQENSEPEEEDELHGKQDRRRRAEAAARKVGANIEAGLLFFADDPENGDTGSIVSLEFHSPGSSTSQEDLYTKAKGLEHGDYAFPTIAFGNAKREAERRRGEEEWLLGGGAKQKSGSRERRQRVEGWLDKMKGMLAVSDDSAGSEQEEDEERIADEHISNGKKRKSDLSIATNGKAKSKDRSSVKKKGREGQQESSKKKRKKSIWGGLASDEDGSGGEDEGQTGPSSGSSGNTKSKGKKSKPKDKKSAAASSQEDQDFKDAKAPQLEEEEIPEEAGAVDLVVSDPVQEEKERALERRKGDPAVRTDRRGRRVFKRIWDAEHSQEANQQKEQKHSALDQMPGPRGTEQQSQQPTSGSVLDAEEEIVTTPVPEPEDDSNGKIAVTVEPLVGGDATEDARAGSEVSREDRSGSKGDHDESKQQAKAEDANEEGKPDSKQHQMPVYKKHDWRWAEDSLEDGKNPWE